MLYMYMCIRGFLCICVLGGFCCICVLGGFCCICICVLGGFCCICVLGGFDFDSIYIIFQLDFGTVLICFEFLYIQSLQCQWCTTELVFHAFLIIHRVYMYIYPGESVLLTRFVNIIDNMDYEPLPLYQFANIDNILLNLAE